MFRVSNNGETLHEIFLNISSGITSSDYILMYNMYRKTNAG